MKQKQKNITFWTWKQNSMEIWKKEVGYNYNLYAVSACRQCYSDRERIVKMLMMLLYIVEYVISVCVS